MYQMFCVLKREVEEYSFDRPELTINFFFKPFNAPCQCFFIAGKRPGGGSIDVARKLIRENDQCKAAARSCQPILELFRNCEDHVDLETAANLSVRCRILRPPKIGSLLGGPRVVGRR